MDDVLDDLDRRILHELQLDSRRATDSDIASRTDVTGTTVANRIRKLEERDVIQGYYPFINYEAAGYPLTVLFICTTSLKTRSSVAEQALDILGVIGVRETMASHQNIHVLAVGDSKGRIEAITDQLADLGVEIIRSDLLAKERVQPWDHFHLEAVEDSVAADEDRTKSDVSGDSDGD